MAGRIKKFAITVVLVFVVLLLAGITFSIGWRPIVGAKARALTARRFEPTPARLERGRYLAEGVMGCFDCHSEHDMSLPGEPPKEGARGGGSSFPKAETFRGVS